MKILKIILIGLGAIVALFLITALFAPSQATLERSIVINAPVEEVYNHVADLSTWSDWDAWMQQEPDAKNETNGEPGEGMSRTWEGQEIGSGTMTIEKVVPGKEIHTKIEFTKPWEGVAHGHWTFTEKDGGTEVVWAFEGAEMGYPMKIMNFMMDGMVGGQFEIGLNNLKGALEKS